MGDFLRILVADDHEAVRAGVCSILQSRGDVEICGQAANGREAVQKAGELKPDLVLLVITMPVLDGLSAAKEIHELFPEVVILFLSVHEGKQVANLAKSSGASGYVSKTSGSDILLKAVDIVARHGTFFPG
jgi:DNA-binding NarL/FixJ family response regulator